MVMLLLGFTACNKGNSNGTGNNGNGEITRPPVSASSNILIAYFSCTDTTKGIAKHIEAETKGTSYEITPQVPYTEDDLKYYTNCRADREQADPTARPAISGSVEDIDKYSIVFLGYPIWHGQAPKIIYTFLESYDFSNKTVIPFCTSHSSGIGSSDTNLHSLAPDAEWKSGKRFASGTSQTGVKDWIDSLDIKTETEIESMQIYFTIGNTTLAATLEDNTATAALKERLKTSPITIEMSDYGGFEKVGGLGFDLPTSNEQITTQPCDFVLYQGNQLVIFYGSNSWSYTRLGKITGVTSAQLKTVLGNGSVSVTLSLSNSL